MSLEPGVDIVVPVYNEGENVLLMLESLRGGMKTPYRVLICYDMDEDTTVPAVKAFQSKSGPKGNEIAIEFVKNKSRGPHSAVTTGFARSTAPAVLVIPADDDYNAPAFEKMAEEVRKGADVACLCRFIPGGFMKDCPWVKAILVRTAAWTLYHLGRIPARDSTNGLRMFSRRAIREIVLESEFGFTYSIEILAKVHRLGWKITDVPGKWIERKHGQSRFKVLNWIPHYMRWYFYIFATTYLRRPSNTVQLVAQ